MRCARRRSARVQPYAHCRVGREPRFRLVLPLRAAVASRSGTRQGFPALRRAPRLGQIRVQARPQRPPVARRPGTVRTRDIRSTFDRRRRRARPKARPECARGRVRPARPSRSPSRSARMRSHARPCGPDRPRLPVRPRWTPAGRPCLPPQRICPARS